MRLFLLAMLFPLFMVGQDSGIKEFGGLVFQYLKSPDSVLKTTFFADTSEVKVVVDSSLALLYRKNPSRKPIAADFRAPLYQEAIVDHSNKVPFWLQKLQIVSDSLHVLEPDTSKWKMHIDQGAPPAPMEGSLNVAFITLRIKAGKVERRIEMLLIFFGPLPGRWRMMESVRWAS